MATAADEHVHVSPFIRGEKLRDLATAARSLAIWADECKDDLLIAAQLGLTVRRFAVVLDERPSCEAVSREIDSLGQRIQAAGRALPNP
jgi:hypothetical protein